VLKLFSPYVDVDEENPIFAFELSRLRWLQNPRQVLRLNWLCWVWIPFSVAVIWLILETIRHQATMTPSYDVNTAALTTVFWFRFMWMGLSTFYVFAVTLAYLHLRFHESRWDLLRLTSQPEEGILAGCTAIAWLRAWPLLAVENGLRVTVMVLFCAGIMAGYLIDGLFLGWIPLIAFGLAFGLILLLEVVYRYRFLVTLSMLVASKIYILTFGFLLAFLSTLVIYAAQVVLIGLLYFSLRDVCIVPPDIPPGLLLMVAGTPCNPIDTVGYIFNILTRSINDEIMPVLIVVGVLMLLLIVLVFAWRQAGVALFQIAVRNTVTRE